MNRSAPKPAPAAHGALDDTVLRSLTPEDRERLAMDAWEPTLLRKLLEAEGKLRQESKQSDA